MNNNENIAVQFESLLKKQEAITKLQLEMMNLQAQYNQELINFMNNFGPIKTATKEVKEQVDKKTIKFKLDKLGLLTKETIIKISKHTIENIKKIKITKSKEELEKDRNELNKKFNELYHTHPEIIRQVAERTHDKNDPIAMEIEKTMMAILKLDKKLGSNTFSKIINTLKPANIKKYVDNQVSLIKIKKDNNIKLINNKVSQMKAASVDKIANGFKTNINKATDWYKTFIERFSKKEEIVETNKNIENNIENDLHEKLFNTKKPIVVKDSKISALTMNFKNLIKSGAANRKKWKTLKQIDSLIHSSNISDEYKAQLRQMQIDALNSDNLVMSGKSI